MLCCVDQHGNSELNQKWDEHERWRQTGQNHPLALRFLRGWGGAVVVTLPVGAADAAEVDVPSPPSAGAAVLLVLVVSLGCTIVPPAPNSTILMAHSLHATRWRHGRRITSRGDERHNRHSEEGSSSRAADEVVMVGGYVCVPFDAVEGCDLDDKP